MWVRSTATVPSPTGVVVEALGRLTRLPPLPRRRPTTAAISAPILGVLSGVMRSRQFTSDGGTTVPAR